MKRVAFAGFLLLADLVVFAAGSFLRPFGLTSRLASSGFAVRLFVWDGVLLLAGLFLLTLAVEALGQRLRSLAIWTTAAFLLAGLVGLLLRFGFVTREL